VSRLDATQAGRPEALTKDGASEVEPDQIRGMVLSFMTILDWRLIPD
jgi:hypothetical protein